MMMMKTPHAIAAAAVILAASPLLAQSQQTAPPQNQDPASYDRDLELLRNAHDTSTGLNLTANQLTDIDRIADELAALDRKALPDTDWAKEWAGIYSGGFGWGGTLIYVAPKSGIAVFSSDCTSVDARKCADIAQVLPDGLKLKLTDDPNSQYHMFALYISQRMYLVKWADRRFLVPDSGMIRFVNTYNQGGGNRETMLGICERDRDNKYAAWPNPTKTRGKPELPPQYAKLLREAPIKLTVTSVAPQKIATGIRANAYEITFEGGQDQGAYVGLELQYNTGGTLQGAIELTKVDAKTSQATLTTLLNEGKEPKLPQVGDVLSNTDSLFDSVPPEEPVGMKERTTTEPASTK